MIKSPTFSPRRTRPSFDEDVFSNERITPMQTRIYDDDDDRRYPYFNDNNYHNSNYQDYSDEYNSDFGTKSKVLDSESKRSDRNSPLRRNSKSIPYEERNNTPKVPKNSTRKLPDNQKLKERSERYKGSEKFERSKESERSGRSKESEIFEDTERYSSPTRIGRPSTKLVQPTRTSSEDNVSRKNAQRKTNKKPTSPSKVISAKKNANEEPVLSKEPKSKKVAKSRNTKQTKAGDLVINPLIPLEKVGEISCSKKKNTIKNHKDKTINDSPLDIIYEEIPKPILKTPQSPRRDTSRVEFGAPIVHSIPLRPGSPLRNRAPSTLDTLVVWMGSLDDIYNEVHKYSNIDDFKTEMNKYTDKISISKNIPECHVETSFGKLSKCSYIK